MYKPIFNGRTLIIFRQFQRKSYSLFACLGREVVISVLSVATLSSTKAASISDETWRVDSTDKATLSVWLEDVGVSGSRAPLTKSQAARMVTVLSREDIQAAPVQSVNDLLKYAVGVDVRQRGASGTQTDISVRGGTQDQTAILLNGVNICDPQTGHNALDIPVQLSEIVRIEVLEGPAGRVYGTSALVGAINIVTHPAQESSIDAGIEGGSFGYAKASMRANAKSGRWNNQFSGSYQRSDGYSRAANGNLNTDLSGSKAFYQGSYEDDDVRVRWHAGISDKGWGSGTFYATPKWHADNQYEHTTKILTAIQAETKHGALRFMPSIYWNQNRDRYEGYRGMAEKMKFNYNRTDVYGVSLNSYFDWSLGRTAFGAELRNEDLVSGNLGEPLAQPHHISGTDRDYTLGINRTNISAHLEHNVVLEQLTVSAGFIAVKNTWNGMNMRVYPGIDASYRIGQKTKVFASWNTSLRMPSFTEMYYKMTGYAANPYLKPEEMEAIEAGAQYSGEWLQAKATLYHHHGKNMIDWILDNREGADAKWKSVNHTKLNSVGIETTARLDFARMMPSQGLLRSLSLAYNYCHQDKDLEEGVVSQYALEYLRHKFTANLDLRILNQLYANISWRWQDREGQYTDFQGIVHSYKPYSLADIKLSWKKPAYEVYAQVNNLFDNRKYVDYGNVPQPGIWFVAGATIHLGL